MPGPDTGQGAQGRVCVVGSGPAGLAMARALKRVGLAFDVYERNPGIGGI
jgi:NADPH-dependent 2,4-dienoyl-CoA reductase/sulfur reductase-like enzyme